MIGKAEFIARGRPDWEAIADAARGHVNPPRSEYRRPEMGRHSGQMKHVDARHKTLPEPNVDAARRRSRRESAAGPRDDVLQRAELDRLRGLCHKRGLRAARFSLPFEEQVEIMERRLAEVPGKKCVNDWVKRKI